MYCLRHQGTPIAGRSTLKAKEGVRFRRSEDDPRNGLVLYASHHRVFDAGLFTIEPNSLRIRYSASGPDADSLSMNHSTLELLPRKPHKEAIEWLWSRWRAKAKL